ncbi:MAG TPA: IS1 family transposase [Vicinamibacterales bacterium]|nr:IS1 family transposase [Vicinamibacterales bacterium]
MNRLPAAKRAQMLQMLCEGNSMRSVSRMTDTSINTVSKLLVDAGKLCAAFHDEMVRNVGAKRVQCDEIWSFCYAKKKTVQKDQTILDRNADAGDVWTWTAIDADSKLVIAYLVSDRTAESAYAVLSDVKARVTERIQLTTDQLSVYLKSADRAFGLDVDYGMLHKIYAGGGDGRYSPAECIGTKKIVVTGEPDPKHISTSYVERSNLTMRMHMRRFTRLTNAFSKKFENHAHMVAIYAVWYNFVRPHKTLRVTPAMQAGLTDRVWDFAEIVALMDEVAKPEPQSN